MNNVTVYPTLRPLFQVRDPK